MTAARWDPEQLVLGDATDPGLFEPDLFQLTVTSPPYNVGLAYGDDVDDAGSYEDYLDFSRKWLENVYRWTAPAGRLCLNIPLDKNSGGKQPVTADLTNIAREAGWRYHATIIWNEGNISRRTAWGSWRRPSAPHIIAPVETIVVLYKHQWKREHQGDENVTITRDEFMEWTNGVWEFGGAPAKRIGHPAPFPIELPRRCIRLLSYKGDNVLDPFAGSGSTLIAAIADQRSAYGIELDEGYRQLSLARISAEAPML